MWCERDQTLLGGSDSDIESRFYTPLREVRLFTQRNDTPILKGSFGPLTEEGHQNLVKDHRENSARGNRDDPGDGHYFYRTEIDRPHSTSETHSNHSSHQCVRGRNRQTQFAGI